MTCSSCNTDLPIESFTVRADRPPLRRGVCRSCRSSKSAVYKKANRAHINALARSNRGQKRRDYERLWYHTHKDKCNAATMDWQRRNKAKMRASWKRARIKRRSTPEGAIRHRVSTQMRLSLRKSKDGLSWESLVGYTRKDLMAHLESKFTPGMTWDLFLAGEIHIDHKMPVSSFRFSSPDDQAFKECWAITNLQPLWRSDNLRKHCKIPPVVLSA